MRHLNENDRIMLTQLSLQIEDANDKLRKLVANRYGCMNDWSVERLCEVINILPPCEFKTELEQYWDSI